jgi:hypothetical protein
MTTPAAALHVEHFPEVPLTVQTEEPVHTQPPLPSPFIAELASWVTVGQVLHVVPIEYALVKSQIQLPPVAVEFQA